MVGEKLASRRNAKVTEKSKLRQNVEAIGLALAIALVIKSSVVQAFWVPSGSMLPTIQIGDHIFVNKLAYSLRLDIDIPMGPKIINKELWRFGKLQRGEVVVFVSPIDPSTDLIKRVIAVEGDTVEIRAKKVYVNGEPIEDPNAHFVDASTNARPRDHWGPEVVPQGKFFVLGDNRDNSYDSRFWGYADLSDLKGRAIFVYWSRDGGWPRFERLGHFIR